MSDLVPSRFQEEEGDVHTFKTLKEADKYVAKIRKRQEKAEEKVMLEELEAIQQVKPLTDYASTDSCPPCHDDQRQR